MVTPICQGHALFVKMKSTGEKVNPGRVVVRIIVEYTGEVQNVSIEETNIQSKKFISKLIDFIMSEDFVMWGADENDTVFLYPVTFGE